MSNAVLDRLTKGDLDSIVSGAGCKNGGLYKVFFGAYSEMDWAATETASQFDTVTSSFTGLTPVATKVIYDFGFELENAKIDNTLINETFYETIITLMVIGKTNDIKGTLNNIKNYCGDLWMAVIGNDKSIQHVGVMRNTANDGFQKVFDPLVLAEHLDTSGTSSEKSRHEITFKCKSEYLPLNSTMTLANYIALL